MTHREIKLGQEIILLKPISKFGRAMLRSPSQPGLVSALCSELNKAL